MREPCPIEYAEREQYNAYLDAEEKALSNKYGYGNVPKTISPIRNLIGRIRAKLESMNVIRDGVQWGKIK